MWWGVDRRALQVACRCVGTARLREGEGRGVVGVGGKA